jgi:hypothetical protein
MEVLLQVFQFFGALLGTASAAFIVYDQAIRGRPNFALHAKSAGGENYLYVRIVNVLTEDLVVENFRINPQIVALSEDHEIDSMVAAQIQVPRTLILPPLGSAHMC